MLVEIFVHTHIMSVRIVSHSMAWADFGEHVWVAL